MSVNMLVVVTALLDVVPPETTLKILSSTHTLITNQLFKPNPAWPTYYKYCKFSLLAL